MPKTTSTTSTGWMAAQELPNEARLRLEHAGRWVAWSEDFQSVLASGDDPEVVRTAASRLAAPRSVLEWVPPVPVRPVDPHA